MPRKRYRLRVIFLLCLSFLTICYLVICNYKTDKVAVREEKKMKNMLYWTPLFEHLDFHLGLGTEIFENCTYKNCYATYDRSYLPVDQFDAIIFHGWDYTEEKYGVPERRSPDQIYIFGLREPPPYTRNKLEDSKNFYNWTMTYRLDSDIPWSYGLMEKAKRRYQLPSDEEINARPGKIAWFVSRCESNSKREAIVEKLSKFLPVDVYGKCGNLTCGNRLDSDCYNFLEQKYKFYLSFENSVCEDYVTEKAYYVLKTNVVPIVYGGADYKLFLPPNSVINVMDFKSIKKLARHISHLDGHTEDYLKLLKWKSKYRVSVRKSVTLCNLCQKLNEPVNAKTYGNMARWWRGSGGDKCSNNFVLKFLRG